MKHFFLFLVFISPSFLIAQKESIKRHSIDLVSGISFGHRIEGEKFKRIKERTDQDLNAVVDPDPLVTANCHIGVDYNIRIIKGFSLKAGVRLSLWSLANDTDNHRTGEDVTIMTYLFLETPLILQYKFIKKKVQPFIEIGGSPMFFLQNKSSGNLIKAPDLSFLIQAGIGVSYQVTSTISIFGQVLSRFQTQEYSSEYYDIDLYPYEIGLEFGTSFHF
jgi:hypothetical protein